MHPSRSFQLLRALIWALVLLLGQWTQLAHSTPPPNGAVLAADIGWHAAAMAAKPTPSVLRAEAATPEPKAPPPAALIVDRARLHEARLGIPARCQAYPALQAAPQRAYDACGPPGRAS